jgi:hypothetical protein
MAYDIGRADDADLDVSNNDDEELDSKEYETMMELERLESIEEDMQELGVATLEDVRRRIDDLHRVLDVD